MANTITYTPELVRGMTDQELAVCHADLLDVHFGDLSHPDLSAIAFEVQRRGLSTQQLMEWLPADFG